MLTESNTNDISFPAGKPGDMPCELSAQPDLGHWLAGLDRGKTTLQICDQVGFCLKADREPDQAIADAGCTPGFRAHTGMGHRRRVRNQALNAAERLGKREDLDRLYETADGVDAAPQLEAQHGAKAALLGRSNGASRIGVEPRIVDGSNKRMPGQELRRGHGVGLLTLDARKERPQTAQRQMRIVFPTVDASSLASHYCTPRQSTIA